MNIQSIRVLKALSNESRLQILQWLKDPVFHFEPQIDGDLVEDGVCSGRIADKLGISAPALSAHMKLLVETGLVRPVKIKGWVFYKRQDIQIAAAMTLISNTI